MRGNVREMSGKIALDLESRENKKIKRKKDRRWIRENRNTEQVNWRMGKRNSERRKDQEATREKRRKRKKRKRIGNQLERFEEKRRKKRNVNERRG